MATIIDMPKLSDTMTVGTLTKWLKNEGDSIKVGDILAEVETDKATMELESFEDGTLLKLFIQEGQEVAIGSPIAAVGKPGEAIPTPSSQPASKSSPAPSTPPTPQPSCAPAPTPPVSLPQITPSPSSPASSERLKASPLARKIAEENQLNLHNLQGSGPHGRIIKADVLSALQSPQSQSPSQPSPAAISPSPAPLSSQDTDIPVSNLRNTIARRLLESKTSIPHFYLDIEVDAAPLIQLRESLNASFESLPQEKGGIKFTINDFILKASAVALQRVPSINSSWQGSSIRKFGAVHLSFGVAVEDALLTPVIQNAHSKSLRQISLEAKDLIAKARSKKLSPQEMSGSTFTVTNLGMFGINSFFGIINPPNAAILSVGATIKKPVVDSNNTISIGHRMTLGFSGDHRVVDGANGAEFLSTLKQLLESPTTLLV